MSTKQRTFGWIQNPSSTDNLKNIVSLFVHESEFYNYMTEKKMPFLLKHGFLPNADLYDKMQDAIKQNAISYSLLKGKGAGKEGRKNAKCSGLAQAAMTGQQSATYIEGDRTISIKKPYVDDWSADGFLRWAISIGFLDYHSNNDTCSVTETGRRFVSAKTKDEETEILGTAYLSYPPVCRVLGILSDGNHYTKFEIGSHLGFVGEAGFTSYPQNLWVRTYEQATNQKEKSKIRSDYEGSSDKYARMICSWLSNIGWVNQSPKKVTETIGGTSYSTTINSAYTITSAGLKNLKRAMGKSKLERVPKIVYPEMLSTKAPGTIALRSRRAHIIHFINGPKKRTIPQIVEHLKSIAIPANEVTVLDDIKGFVNIGLNVQVLEDTYQINDSILKLQIPATPVKNIDLDSIIIKERVRERLLNIDHKYLSLIDYSFQGKENQEFEVVTIDLFTNCLQFIGKHLGGSRKPDGIISYNRRGVIIDNKAYSKGFTISRSMADEMIRYVQENNDRREERNKNRWWEDFPDDVNLFNFLFISSLFKGNVTDALNGIKQATNTNGAVINTENLLYYADAIKGGLITREQFIDNLDCNSELTY